MYLADFIEMDGRRHFISANLRTGEVKMERVTYDAFEQFILNILGIGEDGTLPSDGLKAASEVSA